jgi:hypothetical protein
MPWSSFPSGVRRQGSGYSFSLTLLTTWNLRLIYTHMQSCHRKPTSEMGCPLAPYPLGKWILHNICVAVGQGLKDMGWVLCSEFHHMSLTWDPSHMSRVKGLKDIGWVLCSEFHYMSPTWDPSHMSRVKLLWTDHSSTSYYNYYYAN